MAWAYSRLIITGMYIKWIGFDEEDDEEREVKLMDDEGCWRMGSDGDTKRQRDLLFNTKIPVSPRRSMAVDTEWIGSWSVSRFSEVRSMSVSFNSVTQSTSTKLNGLIWLLRTLEV